MKPTWTPLILLALLISSCAANRIESHGTPEQLSRIKSGHFKGSELACTPPKLQHPGLNDKSFHAAQSVLHSPAELALHNTRKTKKNISSVNFSKTQPKDILVYRESLGEDISLNLPEINLPLKQTFNISSYSPPILKHEVKENTLTINYLEKFRIPILTQINQNQPKLPPSHKRENLFYLMVLLVGSLSLAGLKYTPELAGNISYWAALNPGKSRFIISIIQIMTGMAGLILGIKLADTGTHFSDLSKGIIGVTFLTSVLLYPVRKSRINLLKRTYFKQKIHDLVLFITGFVFMVYAGNHYSRQISSLTNIAGKQQYLEQEYYQLEKDQSRNPQEFFYHANHTQDMPAQPPEKGWSKGEKVLLTILTFMAATGLGYGVAVLSCELSCSGLNGLAVSCGHWGRGTHCCPGIFLTEGNF